MRQQKINYQKELEKTLEAIRREQQLCDGVSGGFFPDYCLLF